MRSPLDVLNRATAPPPRGKLEDTASRVLYASRSTYLNARAASFATYVYTAWRSDVPLVFGGVALVARLGKLICLELGGRGRGLELHPGYSRVKLCRSTRTRHGYIRARSAFVLAIKCEGARQPHGVFVGHSKPAYI